MLPHLIRKQLLDRTWDSADLDAAAEFWLRLYEAAAKKQGFTATPSHRVEVRLRGFARPALPALQDELCRRVASSDLPLGNVRLGRRRLLARAVARGGCLARRTRAIPADRGSPPETGAQALSNAGRGPARRPYDLAAPRAARPAETGRIARPQPHLR